MKKYIVHPEDFNILNVYRCLYSERMEVFYYLLVSFAAIKLFKSIQMIKFYNRYLKIREPNIHKMKPIPVSILPKK